MLDIFFLQLILAFYCLPGDFIGVTCKFYHPPLFCTINSSGCNYRPQSACKFCFSNSIHECGSSQWLLERDSFSCRRTVGWSYQNGKETGLSSMTLLNSQGGQRATQSCFVVQPWSFHRSATKHSCPSFSAWWLQQRGVLGNGYEF